MTFGDDLKYLMAMVSIVVVATTAALAPLALLFWLFDDTAERQAAFMDDCLQHRPQYECTAMWRAGENHTSVVPVPVVVGR